MSDIDLGGGIIRNMADARFEKDGVNLRTLKRFISGSTGIVSISGFTAGPNIFITGTTSAVTIGVTSVISATTYYGDGSHLTGIIAGFSGWTASTGINSIIANNGTGNIANNYSIVGGSANTVSGHYSAILNGVNNDLSGTRSAIIGGQSITGTSDDTVYVPYLNIKNINSGTSIINLGLDSSGNVVTGNTSTSNGSITRIFMFMGG